MGTARVICATVMVAALPLAACNRPQAEGGARVAAAEVKDVAGRASEKFADSWLATKIQAHYFADQDVKARNILVTARDGVVTLKGRVATSNAHQQALEIARNTAGVRSVNDQLTLNGAPAPLPGASASPAGSQSSAGAVATTGLSATDAASAEQLNDPGITANVQSKYFLDPDIKARRIDVDTRHGVVALRGEVASDDERGQALILARTTEGVQRVEDSLTVNAGLAQTVPSTQNPATAALAHDAALTMQLEAAFAADRQVKGAAIEVMARDGVVLLEGTVPTAAARQRALALARETKGVLQIIDRLTIGHAL